MPKLFGDRFARAIHDLNQSAGRSNVTLTRHNQSGTRTPGNPKGSESSDPPVSGIAPIVDFEQDEIDGTNVQAFDQKVYLSPITFGTTPPDTSDEITIAGKPRTIVKVREIRPGDTSIVHVVQVR